MTVSGLLLDDPILRGPGSLDPGVEVSGIVPGNVRGR